MEKTTEALLLRLKTLGDRTRLRLVALCQQGECSVSELTRIVGQSQPRISQHLKQLCDAGLLERFRDGKHVFYKVPARTDAATALRQLLELIPQRDPVIVEDLRELRLLRGEDAGVDDTPPESDSTNRAIHKALVALTVTAPIGDVLDIGCGRGAILKLLAGRAHRAIGVDIDADARQLARAELMLAGLPNCSLRQGNMYRLPFDDAEFNTIILDDVLADASKPIRVLVEARRLLKPGGRLFVLQDLQNRQASNIQQQLAQWSSAADLRLAPAQVIPQKNPAWLLSVAQPVSSRHQAA